MLLLTCPAATRKFRFTASRYNLRDVLSPDFTAAARRITAILRRQREGKRISATDAAFCQRVAQANQPVPPKEPGRPRETDAGKLPIYSSMAEASARAHVPLALLKQSKKSGCDAFKWNRVDLEKFLAWVFGRTGEEEDGIDWSNELKKWLAKRAKMGHDRDARKVMDMDQAETEIRACMGALFSELDRVFVSELPGSLKGQDELAISAKCQGEIDRMKKSLREKFQSLLGSG